MKNNPELRLWLQVMRQGLADLADALNGDISKIDAGEIDLKELRRWIFEDTGLGSFEWLCDAFELDAGRARDVIASYWSRRLEGKRVRPDLRRIPATNGRMRVMLSAHPARTRPHRLSPSPTGPAAIEAPALFAG